MHLRVSRRDGGPRDPRDVGARAQEAAHRRGRVAGVTPLTPAFVESLAAGRARFEQGGFFEAHEAWEVGWRLTRGDEKRVLQALVLWAAARVQVARGKADGAKRLLTRAMARAQRVDDSFDGLDVPWLREALLTAWARLGAVAEPVLWPADAESAPALLEVEHRQACPYCGEAVLLSVAPEDSLGARYVEDCPVCCRPWDVAVILEDQGVSVTLRRHDA